MHPLLRTLIAAFAAFGLLVSSPPTQSPAPAPAQEQEPSPAPPEQRFEYGQLPKLEVALGVQLSRKRYTRLFGAPQSLQILELDPREHSLRVRIAAKGGFFRTSEFARKQGAIAAVNGGYFSRKAEAVGLLRINGKQLYAPNEKVRGALLVGPKGRVRIGGGEAATFAKSRDALAAGPLLVQEGAVNVGTEIGHFDKRHPRTAVGIAPDGRIYLVTVDGRSKGNAAGMTCEELARIFVGLGCESALNLDGGGSTTMWVRGEGETGVVNHPSDNRTFDPAGERRVANCVLIHAKDVVLLEEGAVTPQPTETGPLAAMRYLSSDDASGGRWLSIPGGITVGIDARLDFRGRWRIEARLPRAATPPTRITWNPAMLESKALPGRLHATGTWHPLGSLLLDRPGELRLHFASKQPFGVDAIRLVQH
jgi:exopolysaccharide biosynthesis protein